MVFRVPAGRGSKLAQHIQRTRYIPAINHQTGQQHGKGVVCRIDLQTLLQNDNGVFRTPLLHVQCDQHLPGRFVTRVKQQHAPQRIQALGHSSLVDQGNRAPVFGFRPVPGCS